MNLASKVADGKYRFWKLNYLHGITNTRLLLLCIVIVIAIYFPARHARRYNYIEDSEILNELVISNVRQNNTNLKVCTYEDLILNSRENEYSEIYKIQEFERNVKGGEYVPATCIPLYTSAILVPYRNRTAQLAIFLNYMHHFLQNQRLHYRIFIVEQNDNLPFNRAKLLNYGAKVAIQSGIECLILHDVDLIPLNTGNMYACSRRPRHMSSSIDVFRFNLPYLQLVGGALSIQSNQFQRINGMSNLFDGWGAEDDDFYRRLEAHDLIPYRFSPRTSKYMMLQHRKEKASQKRFEKLKNSLERHRFDGLNTLEDNLTIKLEDLYTHVIV